MELITSFGLPKEISAAYTRMGVSTPWKWQVDCLQDSGVMNGVNNLIYCAPTGSGKTFIAEIVILRTACVRRKKSLFILPYVSLVVEKEKYMKTLLTEYNKSKLEAERIKVNSFHGGTVGVNINSLILKSSIIICTVEKAVQILNIMITADKADRVGCCVVDELHQLGDNFNGALLEGFLCKLQYLIKKNPRFEENRLQIIGMSATIGNVGDIATWLGARLYVTDFRPIPLSRYLVIKDTVQGVEDAVQSTIPLFSDSDKSTWNELKWKSEACLSICKSALDNKQVLVFCPTKACCSQLCLLFAESMTECNNVDVKTKRQAFRSCLIAIETGSMNAMELYMNALLNGACFHHAGLSVEERTFVEDAFRDRTIRILFCTTTLAAGINLPANIVIIFSLNTGASAISASQYNQMCGRAGRPGYISGNSEAYLLATPKEARAAASLMVSTLPNVKSQLDLRSNNGGQAAMKRLLMDAFAILLLKSSDDVANFIKMSLVHFQASDDERIIVLNESKDCINYLLETSALQRKGELLEATRFGRAIAKCGFFNDEAVIMYKELAHAQDFLFLSSQLHILYLISPLSVNNDLKPNWKLLYDACISVNSNPHSDFGQLSQLLKSLPGSSGLEHQLDEWSRNPPASLVRNYYSEVRQLTVAAQSKESANRKSSSKLNALKWSQVGLCTRAWEAWILLALVKGMPEVELNSRYGIDKPIVCDLLAQTQIMVSRTRKFCNEIGWCSLELLIGNIKKSLDSIGNRSGELGPLLACPRMTPRLAVCLWNGGIKNPLSLAQAEPTRIAQILHLNVSFASNDSVSSSACTDPPALPTHDEYQRGRLLSLACRLKNDAKDAIEARDEASVAAIKDIPLNLMRELHDIGHRSAHVDNDNDGENDIMIIRSEYKRELCTIPEEKWIKFSKLQQFSRRIVSTQESFHRWNSNLPKSDRSIPSNSVHLMYFGKALSAKLAISQLHAHSGFAMRHLRGRCHWNNFIACGPTIRCISIQIVMRRLPNSQVLAEKNKGHRKVAGFFYNSNISMEQCQEHTEEGLDRERHWFSPVSKPFKVQRDSVNSSECHAIAGVAICCGGPEAFFLPLPVPLPLLNFRDVPSDLKVKFVTASMSTIPACCRELVCHYVGEFNAFLGNPSELGTAQKSACFLLNRAWVNSARTVLRSLWISHGSQSWELLAALLNNSDITLVGANLQSQLRALRDRGVTIICGPLEDPVVAARMLQFKDVTFMRIRLPSSDGNKNSARLACFRAIAAMRSMAMLESKLLEHGKLSLFRNISMPLVYVAAVAEHAGLPFSAEFINTAHTSISNRLLTVTDTDPLTPTKGLFDSPGNFLEEDTDFSLEVDEENFLQHVRYTLTSASASAQASTSCITRVDTSWNMLSASGDLEVVVPVLENLSNTLDGITASKDCFLLAVEYADINVRLLAHLSCDTALRDICCSESNDVYAEIGALWTGGVHVSDEESKMAYSLIAKLVVSARMDGFDASEITEVRGPYESCCAIFESFRQFFPEAEGFLNFVESSQDFSTTLLGRSVMKGELCSRALIDGSISDLVKLALLTVNRELEQFELRNRCEPGSCARLVFERKHVIVYEVTQHTFSQVQKLIRNCMESLADLHVPLRVNMKCGLNWNDLNMP